MVSNPLRIVRVMFAIVLFGLWTTPPSFAQESKPQPQSLSPREVLLRVENVYATMQSYRDSGNMEATTMIGNVGKFEHKASFTTAFVRDGPIRLEWSFSSQDPIRRGQTQGQIVIWANGDQLRTLWPPDLSPSSEPPSRDSALNHADRITRQPPSPVHVLLLTSPKEGTPDRLIMPDAEYRQLADSEIDGRTCIRIERTTNFAMARGPRAEIVRTFWVEGSTFVLRRVESEVKYLGAAAGSSLRQTVTISPRIDEDIPAVALASPTTAPSTTVDRGTVDTRLAAARSIITRFDTAFNAFEIDTGRYPTNAEGVQALVTAPPALAGWHGPYLRPSVRVDPWARPYQYLTPGIHNKNSFDVWSTGPDRTSGTEDDIGNWAR